MYSGVEEHVTYQIANASMRDYPYPHIYVESVFPDDFYLSIRRNWPESSALVSLANTGRVSPGAYPERFVLPFNLPEAEKFAPGRREFWREFGNWFLGERFLVALLKKFSRSIQKRFGENVHKYSYSVDSLIVRDHTNYNLGPHTDAPHKLLSLLFYCPDDDSRKHLGTSIYLPLDPEFRCPGGPHHPYGKFQRVKTMEYKPNTLFAFFKTDNSFHGVEPIADKDVLRDVLLYDIRVYRSPQ